MEIPLSSIEFLRRSYSRSRGNLRSGVLFSDERERKATLDSTVSCYQTGHVFNSNLFLTCYLLLSSLSTLTYLAGLITDLKYSCLDNPLLRA